MQNVIPFLTLGLIAGVASGLIGIGGGIIIIPALVMIFGMPQNLAQGTTLALMVPPIGILAAWTYYKQGYVDVRVAALICVGFLLGGLVGAKLAVGLSNRVLQKIFGSMMLLVSMKMIFSK